MTWKSRWQNDGENDHQLSAAIRRGQSKTSRKQPEKSCQHDDGKLKRFFLGIIPQRSRGLVFHSESTLREDLWYRSVKLLMLE